MATRTQINVIEAAALLGRSKKSVQRGIQSGQIPATKLPGKTGAWLISRTVVDRMVREQNQDTLEHAS